MNRVVKIVLGVLLVAAIAAGSFYGGMVYGQAQDPEQTALAVPEGFAAQRGAGDRGEMPPAGAFGAIRGQGGMLAGQIVSVGDGVLTLEDDGGQQIQVHVTDTTLIQKQAEVTLADLAEGETVLVSGSQGTDGSLTARMVQVSSGGFGLPSNMPPGGQPGSGTGSANP